MATPVDLYNVVVSVLGGVGLIYLLYSGKYVVNYRRFFLLIMFGLFLSVLGGPLLFFISESLRHAIHGLATFFITLGMYDLVRAEVKSGYTDVWTEILFEDTAAFEGAVDDD